MKRDCLRLLGIAIATALIAVPADVGASPAPAADVSPTRVFAPAVGVAVNPGNDRQYVFWRAHGGRLMAAWFDGGWRGPVDTGWISASSPAVAATASGHEFVFWEGINGDLYEAWNYGSWSRPQDLTRRYHWGRRGQLTSAPGVAVNPISERQYVFWKGLGGLLVSVSYDGVWSRPEAMGWRSASSPAVAATASGHEFVFWRGMNGDLYEAWNYVAWSRPRDLTRVHHWGARGELSSAPGVAVNPISERQYVLWRGRRGRLMEARFDGTWRGPVDTGWVSMSAPALAVTTADHEYAFWQGPRGDIWEFWYHQRPYGPVHRWSLEERTGPSVEVVQTTASLRQRLTPMADLRFGGAPPPGAEVITVDDGMRYQRFTGVGAAMTDTSAWLIDVELDAAQRTALMNDLFSRFGIDLGFVLVPMGGSDFTKDGSPYTYDDLPAGNSDPQLKLFTIGHDEAYILPALRQLLTINPQARLFATPWTAPPWMKANQAFDDLGGHGTLLPDAFKPFANYFVKFLADYAAQGIRVASIAPENEPTAGSPFPAMFFAPTDEAQWIVHDLQPALNQANLHPELYGGNDSWAVPWYPTDLLGTPAHAALRGIAWHCYNGIPPVMDALHTEDATLDQIVTECSPGISPHSVPAVLIGSLRNWASAVTLWNLALDPQGGPVQPPNYGCTGCTGVVTIDETTHRVTLNPAYYQLGQISVFVRPGAQRIGSNTFVRFYHNASQRPAVTPGLDDVAFLNPDGGRVVVVYNNSRVPVAFAISWRGHAFSYSLAPWTMVTFRWVP